MGTQSGNHPLAGTMIAPFNTAGLNVRFTQKRTLIESVGMSALCQKRTFPAIRSHRRQWRAAWAER